MYIDLGKIKIHIGFFAAALFAFVMNTDMGERYVITSVCVILHEMTHLLFLFACGVKKADIIFGVGGVAIKAPQSGMLSYKQEIICLLSAPAVNLALGFILLILSEYFCSDKLFSAACINLSLGAVNLMPLSFLDGGGVLEKIAALKSSIIYSEKISALCDYVCLAAICAFSLALVFCGANAASLFFFALYCFINTLAKNKSRNA